MVSEADRARARSESHEVEDSDISSQKDPSDPAQSESPAGKPGRKKNPNSQAARRDQNRIAQREFRLRKQQRIRDLEARVEILSGGKDEALNEMKGILKDLMAENQVLRNLLKSLSTFIGEGAGGLLTKLGWDLSDFNNFVNKAETDTAWESHQQRKKARDKQNLPTPSMFPSSAAAQKRPGDDLSSSGVKRSRGDDGRDSDRDHNGYAFMSPMSTTIAGVPPAKSYPPSKPPTGDNSFFSELIRGSSGSPMFLSQSAGSSGQYGASSSSAASNSYQAPYMSNMNLNVDASLPSMPFVPNATVPLQQQQQQQSTQQQQSNANDEETDDDPKRLEAQKLIHYHLDNYKRNSAYCLPSSLRPTLVQRTVPHESAIDRIPHPELRDRMILLRGRYDLVDCLHDYRVSVTIHGDDVLAHSNWEIGENWLRRYGFLIEQATLNITNRWRRERGDPELRLADLAPPEPTTTV